MVKVEESEKPDINKTLLVLLFNLVNTRNSVLMQ